MPAREISPALRSALEPLRARKRFLMLVADGTGSRQSPPGGKLATLPPAWQDHSHSLHDLFRLECLDDDERQQLREQSQWEENPNFPWRAFAKSLALELALPVAILSMFKLYSPPQPRPHSAEWELFRLACWSDEESCLALITLGNQCAWGVAPMRRLLAGQDANCAIPTPIRMLAEPYGRNASQLPKHHYLHYLDYAYRNDREAELLKLRSGKNATFEPLLQKALAADAVYQTEIAMSLSQHPRADVFAAVLIDYTCPRLLCDWLQKYSAAELGFSHQDIAKILLLRVRAPGPIIQILTVLEKLQPGFARTAIAEDGCNLLWLATPHATDRDQFMPINLLAPASSQPNLLPLYKFLIGKLGVSPFQRNQRGICFADYDLVARAIGQRFALVGLSNRVPGFHDRRYWGFDRSENDDSTHFDSKKSPRP